MVRRSSEAPSPTPGGQTAPGSSIYPPEYIWNSLYDTQRHSFMSTVSASLAAADGQRKRPRTYLTTEEDANDGRVPSLVFPVLPRFPDLDRAAVIADFEHTFRPKKDLIKLRSPEFKASALDGESFDLKSTSSGLQFRKVVSIKDWGNDAFLWAHCFSNYIAIWCEFFAAKHPLCISGMVLFHRGVCELARAYIWQDCILRMALDHHQMVIDKGDLTVSLGDWEIGKALESSYLRPDNVLPAKTAPTTSTTRSTRSSAAPNNDTVVCEMFNSSAGCHWRTCHRRHVCSKYRRTPNHRIEEPSFITQKLSDDLLCRRVQLCTGPVVLSPLGFVPKNDGGWRRIHDLSYPPGRSINESIPHSASAIQYTAMDDILDLILTSGRGCYIIKIDIKDAFRNIPVAPADRPLLAFSWDNKTYMECCLPFGLTTALFIFNLFAEGLDCLLTAYLPLALSTVLASFNAVYIPLTDAFGVPRNDLKDAAGTVVSVLGVEIDTTIVQARMPRDKLARASSEAASLLQLGRVSHKALRCVIGFLQHCSMVIRLGRARLQSLYSDLASFPPHQRSVRRLSHDSREDLAWWRDTLPLFNGIHFFEESRPLVALYTDACDLGLGLFFFYSPSRDSARDWMSAAPYLSSTHAAIVDASSACGDVAQLNITEVSPILQAFLLHSPHWAHHRVLAFTDSAVAFHGLSKQALRGPAHRHLLMLFSIAAALDIEVQPHWLPSSENLLADALSRSDYKTIADICPQWTSSFPLLRQPGSPASLFS
ncbi:hypothetical protein N7448_011167 [Penicillium atrosanguineum]|nr:hypothetical protein N7448_011167 [Penicillium atrosanguineum]